MINGEISKISKGSVNLAILALLGERWLGSGIHYAKKYGGNKLQIYQVSQLAIISKVT